jgi:hypothetical protein
MILALARHIFEHGTEGRFYSQVRKYHHEGGKVYWSMDDTPRRRSWSTGATRPRPTRRGSQPAWSQDSQGTSEYRAYDRTCQPPLLRCGSRNRVPARTGLEVADVEQ